MKLKENSEIIYRNVNFNKLIENEFNSLKNDIINYYEEVLGKLCANEKLTAVY